MGCRMRSRQTGRIGRQRTDEVLRWISEGQTAGSISEKLGVDAETVRKFARRRGLRIQKVDQSGAKHPSWKGGTTLDRSGYILRRVSADGPHGYLIRAIALRGRLGRDQSGYAPEHRIVMHDILGRNIQRGEVVDHIDGNRRNNSPENLKLYPSNAEHLRATLVGRIPNWTPEGKARMTGRPPKNRGQENQPAPTPDRSKTDDLA